MWVDIRWQLVNMVASAQELELSMRIGSLESHV